MENYDSIRMGTPVMVTIIGPDGQHFYQADYSDVSSAEKCVRRALADAVLIVPKEDCVFIIKNMDTLQVREYRINAHGNLTSIPLEQ